MSVPNFAPGTVVAGKFSIRSLLGYGGASATFRAVSQQGREVALKAYSPAVGQRRDVMDYLQRCVAENNALPQDLVAMILEAGYDPATATPFTVTDYLTTPSVGQLVMHRPLSVDEVGAVLRTLAAVLDAAHARELFHHALKPTNLFVDPNGPGNLRVIDFGVGIARSVVPTQEGYIVAAPWMAPEQAQGGAPAGAPADVFSAALVAFFMLTGRSFWRSCQGGADLNAWQRELISPRPPASARAAELGAQLSPSLDAAFARALAVDPRERPPSVGELAASVGGFLGGGGRSSVTVALPSSDAYALDPAPAYPAQPQGYGAGYPPLEQPMQVQHQPQSDVMNNGPTQAPPPTMGSISGTARSPSGRAAPLVVGAVAALLLVGAVAAWFIVGKSPGDTPEPVASGAVSVAPPTPATDTAPPVAPPDPTTTGAAVEAPDAGSEEAGAAAPEDVLVKITCSPEACEAITVDDKLVTSQSDDLRLPPGKHKVTVRRSGFVPQTDLIVVEADKPLEKNYTLVVARAATPSTGRPPVKKDCSKLKLLERQRCERGQ